MWRSLMCALGILLLLAGVLPAIEVHAVVNRVDPQRRMLTMTAGQREQTIHVPEGVKVLDAAGNELPDGLRAKDLQEGAAITLSVDRQDGKMTLRAIRLGAAPGGNAIPRGAAAEGVAATAPAGSTAAAPAGSAAAGEQTWEQLPDGSLGKETEFRGVDGVVIAAYIRKPAGDGPFPIIVWMHGGRDSKQATLGMGRSQKTPVEDLVQAGFAIYAADYRHQDKIGVFPIEFDDTVKAVEAARALPFVDPKRVGYMGHSHGAQVGTRVVSRVDLSGAVICAPAAMDFIEIKKVITGGGKLVPILSKMLADLEQQYGAPMEEIAKDPAKYGYSSGITEAAGVRCPLLVINGRDDDNSPPAVIEAYLRALHAAGKQVDTYQPDHGPHGFYFGRPQIPETAEATRRAVEFFKKQFAQGKHAAVAREVKPVPPAAAGNFKPITNPPTTPYTGAPIVYRYQPHDPWNTPREAMMSFVDPIKEAPHGTQYKTFHSKAIDGEVSYLVALPPGYESDQATRYPVLYYLGASGATPKREASGVQPFVDKAIASKAALPFIVVYCPSLCGNTMYCDSRDGKYPLETVITQDLIPHIDATYRTIARREARGVEGFSMGGFGAAHLGFKFPDIFAVISIKAPPLVEPDSQFAQVRQAWGNLFPTAMAGDMEYFKKNDPFNLVVENAAKLRDHTYIRLTTHVLTGDNWIQHRVEALHQQLLKNNVPHDYNVYESVKTHNPVGVFNCQGERAFDFFNKLPAQLRQGSPAP